jgi:hypothetical protein
MPTACGPRVTCNHKLGWNFNSRSLAASSLPMIIVKTEWSNIESDPKSAERPKNGSLEVMFL